MNRTLFIAICCLAMVTMACNKDKTEIAPVAQASTTPGTSSTMRYAHRDSSDNSLFISQADANKMISSYLQSINNAANSNNFGPDVKSYSIDADSLRAYLADPSIKKVKVFFAHTMDYIDAGNEGKPAGYQSGAMTLVVAGYDVQGNYIYHAGAVLDHAIPCPYTCAPGQAGSDLLQ